MQILKIRAMPAAAQAFAGLERFRQLDLDDVGAPIGKLAHAGGPGADPGQVENGKARQRRRGRLMRHGRVFLNGLPGCQRLYHAARRHA